MVPSDDVLECVRSHQRRWELPLTRSLLRGSAVFWISLSVKNPSLCVERHRSLFCDVGLVLWRLAAGRKVSWMKSDVARVEEGGIGVGREPSRGIGISIGLGGGVDA